MQIMQLLMKGNKQRTQEPTAANRTSSRSHAVLQVTVRQKSRIKNIMQEVRVGRLFMIDLAGSERASQVRWERGNSLNNGSTHNGSTGFEFSWHGCSLPLAMVLSCPSFLVVVFSLISHPPCSSFFCTCLTALFSFLRLRLEREELLWQGK